MAKRKARLSHDEPDSGLASPNIMCYVFGKYKIVVAKQHDRYVVKTYKYLRTDHDKDYNPSIVFDNNCMMCIVASKVFVASQANIPARQQQFFNAKSWCDYQHDCSNSYFNSNSYYDGHAVVCQTGKNQYVYIGRSIYVFNTCAELVKLYSDIRIGVPYTCVVDSEHNVYFLSLAPSTIQLTADQLTQTDDLYTYCWIDNAQPVADMQIGVIHQNHSCFKDSQVVSLADMNFDLQACKADTAHSIKTDQARKVSKASQASKPGNASQASKAGKLCKTIKVSKSIQPRKPSKFSKPGKPVKPGKPGKSVKPVKPFKSGKTRLD